MLVIMAFLLVSVTWWLAPERPSEPVYQGLPLSHWTTNLYPLGSTNTSLVPEAREAIRGIGTNAIPFLLRWIQFKSADADKVAIDANDGRMLLAYGSAHAFEALGHLGNGAVPVLARWANSSAPTHNRYLYLQALAGIGPEGLPALLSVMTNRANNARLYAISAVESLGTNAAPAIPTLIALLQDPDHDANFFAASALGGLRLQPQLAVPALQRLLQDGRSQARYVAIISLGMFRSEARSAVPDLMPFLNDPSHHVRSSATNALRKIAPEVLTNAPAH
jgi:HEAT repeat protein